MILTGKTQPQLDQQNQRAADMAEIVQLQEGLTSTDWYLTREYELKTPVPADVLAQRLLARQRISELRAKWA